MTEDIGGEGARMLTETPSMTSEIPERVRRIASSLPIEQSTVLRQAADRIRKLERWLGIKSKAKIMTRQTNEVEGRLLTLKEAVELYGADDVTYNTASSRYHNRGWPLVEAIATPVRNKKGGGFHGARIKKLTPRK